MRYFHDLEFVSNGHVPRCSVWIDRQFDQYWALNFAPSGHLYWGLGPDQRIPLKVPVAWWTWPGPCFRYGCGPAETWDQYFVTFHGPRAARMFAEGLLPDHKPDQPIMPVSDPEALRSDWDTLFTLLETQGLRDNPEAVHRLEGMLLRLRSRGAATAERADHAIIGLAERIRAVPEQDWDWETEAARYAVSLVHLRRRFREALGVPPHQFLLQTRMEAASRLLLSSDLSAKAVGAAVGVPDPYYFSKLFKAHFHLPPDHYRREADPYQGRTATALVNNMEKIP